RSAHPPRVRRQRSVVVGVVAQRRPDLRPRVPSPADVLNYVMHKCRNARMHEGPGLACACVHLCILAFLCASPARADVTDYLGRPIITVRLTIEGKETVDPALVQVVETRVGRPLSMAEV